MQISRGGNAQPMGPGARPGPLLRMVRDQRLAFVLVGGLNTALSYAAFLCFRDLGHLWGGDAAVLAAQAVAVPIAFALHRRLVFRVTGPVMPDLGRFLLVTAIPIGVNLAVLPVLTTVFRWPVLLAQLMFTVAWVLASFFLHRDFSFRRHPIESAESAASAEAGGSTGVADPDGRWK